jgi:hypothetical protein
MTTFANWTGILEKFHKHFTTLSTGANFSKIPMDLPTTQLHALFKLHSSIASDKCLFNMQLAAMHMSLMLQHKSDDIVGDHLGFNCAGKLTITLQAIPDFPSTIQNFKDTILP